MCILSTLSTFRLPRSRGLSDELLFKWTKTITPSWLAIPQIPKPAFGIKESILLPPPFLFLLHAAVWKRLRWALRNFFDAIAVVRTRGATPSIRPNRQKSAQKIIARGIQRDGGRKGERGRGSGTLMHACWCVNTDSDTMGEEISFVFEGQENRSHYQLQQPEEGGEEKKMQGSHLSATGFTFQPE